LIILRDHVQSSRRTATIDYQETAGSARTNVALYSSRRAPCEMS
jgi:hypothetical protein